MPERPAAERAKDFGEVSTGYTEEQAVAEAKRCLQCKKPKCIEGCPVGVTIPAFIAAIAERRYDDALGILREKNNLPAICGRVCPQETQCEQLCVIGRRGEAVAIGRLERYAADHGSPPPTESARAQRAHRVAVIGAGPAGLTVAGDLARMGYGVTIFEGLHASGGVLRYGIPEFRLPKAVVDREVEYVKTLGVQMEFNVIVGRTITIPELFADGYEAVFIGAGAGMPVFLGIPGENLNGVFSANEFLTRVNLMQAYSSDQDTPVWVGDRVAVLGGGNTAMDAVRTAKRLGAEHATIVYRRSEHEMPARAEEVEHAQAEGIEFIFLAAPVRVVGNEAGWVSGLECVRMELGEPDASGRRRPVPVEGSEFTLDVDTVIVAVGTRSNPILASTTPGLDTNKWGYLAADGETGATSLPGVFAGGDISTGSATVIEAMGAGKRSARAIDEYLQGLDEGAGEGADKKEA
jgi:glutamate synthase (NADPH/NADH) small chain